MRLSDFLLDRLPDHEDVGSIVSRQSDRHWAVFDSRVGYDLCPRRERPIDPGIEVRVVRVAKPHDRPNANQHSNTTTIGISSVVEDLEDAKAFSIKFWRQSFRLHTVGLSKSRKVSVSHSIALPA